MTARLLEAEAALAAAAARFRADPSVERLKEAEVAWRRYRAEASAEVLLMSVRVELVGPFGAHALGARGVIVPCVSAPGTVAVEFVGAPERYVDVPTPLLRVAHDPGPGPVVTEGRKGGATE